ncbi:hypothetical protein COLO4_18840 [Corchorus olitorius]|uniref:non-specific serine/threonine protein kinase n=1 Tax=Corchorus olitorius TaxID=93759 RepID=A0A1R3J7P9_9ROSI|nr:hypothetical protein COLO4_18840 [Corchorus olitorius]
MGSVTGGNGYLSLTPEPDVNSTSPGSALEHVGRVLFHHPVLAWPAYISTTFTVRISPFPNSNDSGDGMTFIIAQDNSNSPPSSYGSYLGIMDQSTQGGKVRQLAVELDTYQNEWDPDSNHVGIDTISIISPVAAESLDSFGIDLKSGRNIKVKIDYNAWKKNLEISMAYSGDKLVSVLNQSIEMADIVPSSVYVGFTAATGKVQESHQVLDWTFTTIPLPYIISPVSKHDKIKTILLIVVPLIMGLLFVAIFFVPSIQNFLRKKKETVKNKADIEIRSRTAANVPEMFTHKHLVKATHNFSNENLLGTGGFGSVYKGTLKNPPRIVAVKKISATSKQGEKEYFAEICTIGRLRHKNIVQLQGKSTPESDVYSFGMVVIEVVCGKRSKGIMDENSLVDYVWNSYGQNELLECVDRQLGGRFDEEQVRRTLIVGLACLHPDSTQRPKIRKVVQIFLNSDEPLMDLPESRPSTVYISVSNYSGSTTTNIGSQSGPELLSPDSSQKSHHEADII